MALDHLARHRARHLAHREQVAQVGHRLVSGCAAGSVECLQPSIGVVVEAARVLGLGAKFVEPPDAAGDLLVAERYRARIGQALIE